MANGLDHVDLTGRAVLIVEDEYFLAKEMAEAVRAASGMVRGPVADVKDAVAIVAGTKVDAAILDIRLGEMTSFPVATILREKGIPLVFVSGYDDWFLPRSLADVPVHRKPADPDVVVRALSDLMRLEVH